MSKACSYEFVDAKPAPAFCIDKDQNGQLRIYM